MCKAEEDQTEILDNAVERLFERVEKLGLAPLGIVLLTKLTIATKIDWVRRTMEKRCEGLQKFKTATDFYLASWVWTEDDPDNKKLMRLH